MLTKEKIKALLKIDTQNKKDTRTIRIMSCDTPVKDNFVYYLNDIRKEFGETPKGFEDQLTLCIYKYKKDLNLFLNGKISSINVKAPTISLTKKLIENAIKELNSFYQLLENVAYENDFSSQTIYDVIHFKLNSYIAILQLCGLLDISDDIYRSKTLARILNAKNQAENYKEGKMNSSLLVSEYIEHIAYFKSQFKIIEEYKLYEEDFLIYVIMFDIRHYKHNRKNRILRKDWLISNYFI